MPHFEEGVLYLRKLLNIRSSLPLIQAPMAGGITGSDLVAAVSSAGCLGSVGAGGMRPASLRALIREIRSKTSAPFNVNLMVPSPPRIIPVQLNRMLEALKPFYDQLLQPLPEVPTSDSSEEVFEELFQVVVDEKVPIVSFVFGIPSKEKIQLLKSLGVKVMGTATSVEEGIALQAADFDVIVAQSSEAGGHRGSFLDRSRPQLVPLHSLITSLSHAVELPIVAAGGIMNGGDIYAALRLGAAGVQMGTAFITTHESSAKSCYKRSLLGLGGSGKGSTVVTKAYTGRWARGVMNEFTDCFEGFEDVPDYPLQSALTEGLRVQAARVERTDLMCMWAGERFTACRDSSVADLIRSNATEFDAAAAREA